MPRIVASAGKPRVSAVTAVVLTVAILYFAQEVLIPLALSVLLAFLLGPLVTRLEQWKLKRIPSVLIVVGAVFLLLFTLGWVVGRQVARLAQDLPLYQDEIVRKAQSLRGTGGGFGSRIQQLGKEIEKAAVQPSSIPATQPAEQRGPAGAIQSAAQQVSSDPMGAAAREAVGGAPPVAATQPGTTPANPLFTVPLPAPVSPVKTLAIYLGMVLGPFGTAGLVIVFTVFMLLDRQGLRDRLIRLISRGRYTVTTRALNDAGARISSYMLAQALVNGSYGMIVGIGLWVIGLTLGDGKTFPSFVLWGLLCAVLRFVPYVGPWVAAVFPIALSLAVYPGFTVFFATVALLVGIELLSNNVMEPWLYGTSTGLSTVALLVAAVFWTWLWGPVGLLMSTPLTVCIVVLGKHVPQLKFLDVMLGDRPALPPAVSYYQRLLADDRDEALEVVETYAKENGGDRVPDNILIPALRIMRRDRNRAALAADGEALILEVTNEAIARLESLRTEQDAEGAAADVPIPAAGNLPQAVIIGCPAHNRAEDLVVSMLVGPMQRLDVHVERASARMLPVEIEAMVERIRPRVIFIAVLPPGGVVQARHLCKRLRKRFADLTTVVGYMGKVKDFDRLLVRLRAAGASYVTTSLEQSISQISASLAVVPPGGLPSPPSSSSSPSSPPAASTDRDQLLNPAS